MTTNSPTGSSTPPSHPGQSQSVPVDIRVGYGTDGGVGLTCTIRVVSDDPKHSELAVSWAGLHIELVGPDPEHAVYVRFHYKDVDTSTCQFGGGNSRVPLMANPNFRRVIEHNDDQPPLDDLDLVQVNGAISQAILTDPDLEKILSCFGDDRAVIDEYLAELLGSVTYGKQGGSYSYYVDGREFWVAMEPLKQRLRVLFAEIANLTII